MPEQLTNSRRKAFEAIFTDLAAAETNEDKARVTFALTEPMLEAQKVMNRYKRRLAYALEQKNTAYGLAAVHAFERDLVATAIRGGRTTPTLVNAEETLLRRAAGFASSQAFTRELEEDFPITAIRKMRELKAWLDENLERMDQEIEAAAVEAPSFPSP